MTYSPHPSGGCSYFGHLSEWSVVGQDPEGLDKHTWHSSAMKRAEHCLVDTWLHVVHLWAHSLAAALGFSVQVH